MRQHSARPGMESSNVQPLNSNWVHAWLCCYQKRSRVAKPRQTSTQQYTPGSTWHSKMPRRIVAGLSWARKNAIKHQGQRRLNRCLQQRCMTHLKKRACGGDR